MIGPDPLDVPLLSGPASQFAPEPLLIVTNTLFVNAQSFLYDSMAAPMNSSGRNCGLRLSKRRYFFGDHAMRFGLTTTKAFSGYLHKSERHHALRVPCKSRRLHG
jgi:hypothetical protein